MNQDDEANQALLIGEVAGSLYNAGLHCELETTGNGNYTGRVLIHRPSGIWAVTVNKLEELNPKE